MRQKNSIRWNSFKQKIKQGAIGVALGATVLSGGCATTNSFKAHLPLTEICQSSKCSKNVVRLIEELRQSTVLITSEKIQGSGIIIGHEKGQTIIVTNRHVVDPELKLKDLSGIKIRNNGKIFTPTQLFFAPQGLDLAVMFVKGNIGPCRKSSENMPKVGTTIIAVGSPLGSEDSVTKGIVSNLNPTKTKKGFKYYTIQTDAAINPGNSGGGIFNAKTGELIGIMTFKIRINPFRSAEGMAFALPISLLKSFPYTKWSEVKKEN